MTGADTRLAAAKVRECRCGHRTDVHDTIALRYCAATKTAALTRGCICHPAPAGRRR
jgi:hypothetical protein